MSLHKPTAIIRSLSMNLALCHRRSHADPAAYTTQLLSLTQESHLYYFGGEVNTSNPHLRKRDGFVSTRHLTWFYSRHIRSRAKALLTNGGWGSRWRLDR